MPRLSDASVPSKRPLSVHETQGAISLACHVQKLSIPINVGLMVGAGGFWIGQHTWQGSWPDGG
jgi:hypothetical protein